MRFVVTAGPTQEPIDPVRYISNRSSGEMGYAIAEAAIEAGHAVTLVSGRVHLAPPCARSIVPIATERRNVRRGARNMSRLRRARDVRGGRGLPTGEYSTKKIKKAEGASHSNWCPHPTSSGRCRTRRTIPGGWLRRGDQRHRSERQKKLREKNCDMIVANDVSRSDIGMESAENEVTIFFRERRNEKNFARAKKNIARETCKNNFKHARKMFDKKNVTISEPCK